MRVLRSSDTEVVVAMADLDHFKALNDTHGHETGDRALRLFAQVLRSSLRSNDLIARYGGEEFAVVLPSCSAEEARAALDQVRVALKHAVANAGLPRFTASFGVVESGEQPGDLAELLVLADAALFDAKHQGRDRVVVHDTEGKLVARSRRRRAAPATNGNGVNGNGNENGNGNARGSGRAEKVS
jgi:diguanylate cyclase (GGDEF)-like protein